MKSQLLVLAKNPVFGKVKTRLAATVGHKKALEVYCRLLRHTRTVALPFASVTTFLFTDYLEKEGDWDKFNQALQVGVGLGDRMRNAFHTAFSDGNERVIIIGTDCFEINSTIIQQAFEELNTHDVVIGPAEDGGYYLLGMRKMSPSFFKNKKWSTETVFLDTIEDVKRLGLSHKCLPTLVDIDTEQELRKFNELL